METFGLLGFIFGMAGLAQVILLKKDVANLKESIRKLGGDSDSAATTSD